MKILHKSKSLNTKMDDAWLESAGINHFWMRWRFNFLVNQFKLNRINLKKKLKIMDLGCGNGILSNQLEEKFKIKVDRVDVNKGTLSLNKKAKGKLICYNIKSKNKKLKNYYNIIFLFDVIEHIRNDKSFLKDSLYHLKSDGLLIINVPSIQMLFSKYDLAVGHLRRYMKEDLKSLAKKINVKIIAIKYWGFFLLPFLVLRKFMLLKHDQKNFKKIIKIGWKTNIFFNFFFNLLMKFELKFFKNLLVGSSLMVIIKKR